MVAARSRQSFTGHTIDALQTLADRLGFWPRLVFDRGFGNESIVEHLSAEGATFYIRLKGGRYVDCDGERMEVKHLKNKDTTVITFAEVSGEPDPKIGVYADMENFPGTAPGPVIDHHVDFILRAADAYDKMTVTT